jgi:hypothetical protein
MRNYRNFEPSAPRLERVEDDHRGHGEQPKHRKPIHASTLFTRSILIRDHRAMDKNTKEQGENRLCIRLQITSSKVLAFFQPPAAATDGRLAIDYRRAAATKRPRHAYDEPKIVPTTAVVCLVDPHVGTQQTDKKRDRRDEPVPKAGPEAGGCCSWDLESRAWSPYR